MANWATMMPTFLQMDSCIFDPAILMMLIMLVMLVMLVMLMMLMNEVNPKSKASDSAELI